MIVRDAVIAASETTKAEILARAERRLSQQIRQNGITNATFSLLDLYETLYANAPGDEAILYWEGGDDGPATLPAG